MIKYVFSHGHAHMSLDAVISYGETLRRLHFSNTHARNVEILLIKSVPGQCNSISAQEVGCGSGYNAFQKLNSSRAAALRFYYNHQRENKMIQDLYNQILAIRLTWAGDSVYVDTAEVEATTADTATPQPDLPFTDKSKSIF